MILTLLLLAVLSVAAHADTPAPNAPPPTAAPPDVADPATYLADFAALCRTDWPHNRAVTIVCHGHSVPAGYFQTPAIHTMEAYPNLLRAALSAKYPHAVINIIVTAIGGENAEQGAKRFERDVLSLHPDIVTIDYALNDRGLGLPRAHKAWAAMIEQAQANGIKVILLTPTPDLRSQWDAPTDPLSQHAAQVRDLARQYHCGLADSCAAFQQIAKTGGDIPALMAQPNHPNAGGHKLVARALLQWFP